MTFISYAQNFEDVILWRALKYVRCGFYIDLGAWSPEIDSVTKAFYDRGWHGINVEPNPEYIRLLSSERTRDLNLGVAIGNADTTCNMNVVANPGLSTLSTELADKHRASGWGVEQITVSMCRLESLWHDYVPENQDVHFLKIDIEGYEYDAIRSNDWQNNRPWIAVVESTKPMSQVGSHESWEPILLEAGYRFAYADGLNRFYVANEHSSLLSYLESPPNYFDDFVTINQVYAERRTDQAEERARAAEREIAELVASRSWRITTPLRKASKIYQKTKGIRVGTLLRQSLRWLIALIKRSPRIKRVLSRSLSRFPRLNALIRNRVLSMVLPKGIIAYQRPETSLLLTPRAVSIYRDMKDVLNEHEEGRV